MYPENVQVEAQQNHREEDFKENEKRLDVYTRSALKLSLTLAYSLV